MLISNTKKFLFVHVPKTAGSSMNTLLSPHAIPSNRRLTRRILSHLPVRENLNAAYFRQHSKLATFEKKLQPDIFSSLHKFAVVRNPYDHMVSYFSFTQKHKGGRLYKEAQSWTLADCISYFETKDKKFASNQTSWLINTKGEIAVDRIMFFEHLDSDFSELAKHINMPEGTELPHENITKRTDYRDYYDKNTKRRVEKLYQADFEMFGYGFDNPRPTRSPLRDL